MTGAATQDDERRPSSSAADAASATFVFADIAGYTALTEAHGDEQAADLVADFFEAVSEELPACGGTHVKTIGDALMLRIPDPAKAVLLGLQITHELLRGHGAPAVRVGLHHGPAIERDGDYFGATVNLAARVAAVAIGGEVLLTAQTAALAPALEGILYQPRGRQTLRNIREPIEPFAAVPQGQPVHGRLPIDPVCQMAVDPEHAVGRLIFNDTAYFFCTLACAAEFARHPDRFIG
jgi:class 3 adenylate cyclase/YHS domain-containing protein